MARTFRKDNPHNFRKDRSFVKEQDRKSHRNGNKKVVRDLVSGAADPDDFQFPVGHGTEDWE